MAHILVRAHIGDDDLEAVEWTKEVATWAVGTITATTVIRKGTTRCILMQDRVIGVYAYHIMITAYHWRSAQSRSQHHEHQHRQQCDQ